MAKAKWYAGAVVSRVRADGIREYLVIDTTSTLEEYAKKPMLTKFCGGTEEYHEVEDKTILHTLRRELPEESNLVLSENYQPVLIHTVNLPGHFKNFYDIPFVECKGELRTEEIVIEGDRMSIPYWVTFEVADRILYGHHKIALQKSEERFRVNKSKKKVLV